LRARGDLAGAARVLEDVRDEWANPRLTPLVRETAKAAAVHPDSAAVAAQLLDHLRVVNPTDREVWEPLLELWARLGNRGALEGLVQDLVAKLMSRGDRSAVRMAWARFLLASGDAGSARRAPRRAWTFASAHLAGGRLRRTWRRGRGRDPALGRSVER
jgi:hypothetical protein